MTLIELLVAITVTGMALSAGYGALSWMSAARSRAEAASDATWRTAAIRRSITGWLAGATLAVTPDVAEFRGVDGERDRRDDDMVSFRTNAPTPLGTGETIVTLLIEHDEASGDSGLVAQFSEPHGVRQARLVLEPRAVALDARYLTGLSGMARWNSSWISSTVLPRGIELRVSAEHGDSLPALLQLPIVVAFASGM